MRFSVCTQPGDQRQNCGRGPLGRLPSIYIPSLMDMDLPALESWGDHISLPGLSHGHHYREVWASFQFQGKEQDARVVLGRAVHGKSSKQTCSLKSHFRKRFAHLANSTGNSERQKEHFKGPPQGYRVLRIMSLHWDGSRDSRLCPGHSRAGQGPLKRYTNMNWFSRAPIPYNTMLVPALGTPAMMGDLNHFINVNLSSLSLASPEFLQCCRH